MNIVVIGKDGQLGKALCALSSAHKITGVGHNECDVTDYMSLERVCTPLAPDVIINCTAVHKLDICEQDPALTFQVNVLGTHNVARIAHALGAMSITMSTDYVFDGTAVNGYVETDLPHPINVYGASKLASEHMLFIGNERSYALRTSALFGGVPSGKGKSFIMQMIDKARAGEAMTVVQDQYTAPTYVHDLAAAIISIVEKQIPFGVYHAVGTGSTSWHAYAETILRLKGITHPVSPVVTTQTPGGPKRPLHSVLLNATLRSHGVVIPTWEDALQRYLQTIP